MMRLKLSLGLILLVAGCALPPDGVNQQNIADYEAALASIGCLLVTEADYLPVELQAGLSRQQVQDITQYELSAGNAERLPDGGVKLITGACA